MRPLMLFVALAAAFGASSGSAAAQDRMPPIPASQLTDAQKKAMAEFEAARKAPVSGPFVPLLRSPEVMRRARAMGDYLRFNSSLPPRLSEFAILITARRWSQNYEWDAHNRLALQGGLSPDIVKALIADQRPAKMAADEEALRSWYIERFMSLKETRFRDPRSYFHAYASLSDAEAEKIAAGLWERINLVNLRENILPTRPRADLILNKGPDHAIKDVALRKL